MLEKADSNAAAGLEPDAGANRVSGEAAEAGSAEFPSVVRILPVRGLVLFPHTMAPLLFSRETAQQLLDGAFAEKDIVGIVAQRDQSEENPSVAELYAVGCLARILRVVRQPEGGTLVLVQGLRRFALRTIFRRHPQLEAQIEPLESTAPAAGDKAWEAAINNLRTSALKLLDLLPEVPEEARATIATVREGEQLADLLATNLAIDVPQKEALLEELALEARVRAIQTHIATQLEIAQIQQKLLHDVQSQFTDAQRRAYLNEQMRAIQRQLGQEEGGAETQAEQLRVRLEAAGLSPEIMAQAEREIKRLAFIPPVSPEYSVIVGYLETLAELPWQTRSEDNLDLHEAQRILDRDHFDLAKVKRRLIEFLAVRKLNPHVHGPILCFLGPPGVGKTSLGQSVADALGRKFARLSLGGIRDEAEIRGHRRTYIGSMPGRIIQELRRAGTSNPVIMFDEIDKIGADFRGDPASALLEVLDPRQNNSFVDRYLDVPFDLSKTIFITTANSLDPIPAALRDRLEILELPGYTEREKLAIAQQYLTGRQIAENGLLPEMCLWEEDALKQIISEYTHEAGVRELERQIAAVCRAVAAQIAQGETQRVVVDGAMLRELLGPAKFVHERRLQTNVPGVATGLAFTPLGGEILHVEATRYLGKGIVTLTGQLGEVMRESVETALSLLRSRAAALGINAKAFTENDIHVHVPAGSVPKDGPSAGVAMFIALASLFTQTPVRADVAMTGEITLRGLVLPVGGLKEKCLAAMRAGVDCVLVPKLNEKDLAEVPEEARERLRFLPVESVDEVLRLALAPMSPDRDRD